MKTTTRLRALSGAALLCLFGAPALADTGVSDDRVSLPDGPGSLEGIGENVGVNASMGQMNYGVPLIIPDGFEGAQPNVGLSYSSGGGNGVLGMGWSMPMPYIERMTYRGLPRYTLDDDFALDGSDQMVRLPDTDPPIFRSRYESGFKRYTWFPGEGEAADGADGWFLVEYPDGAKAFYGADAEGTVVPAARMQGDLGTFRYMLVEKQDVHGNRIRYSYTRDGVIPLPESIGYVFSDARGDTPRYRVDFGYEERRDDNGIDYLSDCAPGYETLLTQRLAAVDIYSNGERIRRYEMGYEDYGTSGGFTRLVDIRQLGLDGGVYPVRETFTYSRALGGVCDAEDDSCLDAFVVDMGPIGDVDIGAGTATLIDINGDALPDIVNTNEGAHTFLLNTASADGTSQFAPGVVNSQLGTAAGHRLGGGITQVMDVNGDGFTDMVNTADGTVLYNRGAGDWLSADAVRADGVPAFDATFDALGEGQLGSVSFLDYDNDKFIDFIVSTPEQTTIYANFDRDGFEAARGIERIGDGETGADLEFSDINGDGMLDATIIRPGEVRHRLNLGWGRWADWVSMSHPYEGGAQLQLAELQDLNGDGLDDLVVVEPDVVRYLLNVAGIRFTEEFIIDSDTLGAALPQRNDATEVLYADMNGNGSTDIVWVERMGSARYLEMFPVRPNLLSRIENGIGKVTDITYATSVQFQAADTAAGEPWAYKLPHPMVLVKSTDAWERLTELHTITEYIYRDGFYDGIEKRFRGYARVQEIMPGGEGNEEGEVHTRFDVGVDDPYYNGLPLYREVFSGGRALNAAEYTYDDCPVAEIPAQGLDLPVRHICITSTRVTLKEGQAPDAWVVTESRSAYDGYGNMFEMDNLGVVSTGGGACAPCDGDDFGRPCGPDCRGDELFVRRAYIEPGAATNDRWLLHTGTVERQYGVEGGPVTETRFYFDGDPFVGLPEGNADRGLLSRRTMSVSDGEVVTIDRNAFDARGNLVDSMGPGGSIDGQTHREVLQYDDDGLYITRIERLLEDPDGMPYRLRQEIQREPAFDRVVESTAWMRAVDGDALDPRRGTFYGYDEFGRLEWKALPGDSPAAPTVEIEYNLGDRASQVIVRNRSASGGPLDLAESICFDGRGRIYQQRNEIAAGDVQVNGFLVFNNRGTTFREYQPFAGDSLDCDTRPPASVPFRTFERDAAYRVTRIVDPDAELYGTASEARIEYGPLWVRKSDREDTDPSSPHAGTPTVTWFDGEQRMVAVDRVLAGGDIATTRVHYDSLGRISGYTDAAGNRRTQTHDLLGRVLQVVDPNQGTTTYAYDEEGNITARVDAEGNTKRMTYDGLNRPVEIWDDGDRENTLVSYVYDAPRACPAEKCTLGIGGLIEQTYPGGAAWYGYDDRGRTVYDAREIEGRLFEFAYGYDNADRARQTTYPDGRVLDFQYDGGSRFAGVDGIIDGVVYDEQNRIAAMQFANGVTETRTFDVRQMLDSLQITGTGGAVLFGATVERDRVANPLSFTDDSDNMDRLVDHAMAFTYDAWYRPTQVHIAPGATGDEVVDYAFDLIDNITAINSDQGADSPVHMGPMAYGAHGPNAIDSAGGRQFGYDTAGRMTTHGAAGIEWDYQDRMVRYTGGIDATYRYASTNTRTFKKEGDLTVMYPSRDFEVRDGTAVTYVRVGDRVAARLENPDYATEMYTDIAPADGPDGRITVADAWLSHAASEGLVDVEGDPSPADALLAAGTMALLVEGRTETWLHQDLLNSVVLATRDGAETGRQAFYATGTPRLAAPIDPHGFTGQEHDRTGLLHMAWRYLDPTTGRWLNPDPLFRTSSAALMNLQGESTVGYAYAANRMSTRIDPTGLSTRRLFDTNSHKTTTQKLGSAKTQFDLFKGKIKAKKDKWTGVSWFKRKYKERKRKKTKTELKPKGKVKRAYTSWKIGGKVRQHDAHIAEDVTAFVATETTKELIAMGTGDIPVVSDVAKKVGVKTVETLVYLPGDLNRGKKNPGLLTDTTDLHNGFKSLQTINENSFVLSKKDQKQAKKGLKGKMEIPDNSMSISADATFQMHPLPTYD